MRSVNDQPESSESFQALDAQANASTSARPTIDFGRRKIPANQVFFKFPTKIGKTLAGYSNLIQGEKPTGQEERNVRMALGMGIGLAVGILLCVIISPEDAGVGAFLLLLPLAIGIGVAYTKNKINTCNLYLGSEGFAIYECSGKTDNITLEKEVRWDQVTDLFVSVVENHTNGAYTGTKEEYNWLRWPGGELIHAEASDYHRNWKTSELPPKLLMSKVCELQWTNYLLESLERNIQHHGYETFRMRGGGGGSEPAEIQLNHDSIAFVKKDGERFTYRFTDIQKIYWSGNKLRIQHKNFEKTLFFFKSGNEDEINMLQLYNRKYFMKALERMLG